MDSMTLVARMARPWAAACGMCAALLWALGGPKGTVALGQAPTFPTTGYNTILLDPEEAPITDKVDILSVGYQEDGTYAYFRLVVRGTMSLSSDRYFLYFDLDSDTLPDRRLRNRSQNAGRIDTWSGSEWVSGVPENRWAEDPDDTPDDHGYVACLLTDINAGDFTLKAGSADTANQDSTAREPWDDANMDDWTGGSSNPTVVEVLEFRAIRRGKTARLTWRVVPFAEARIVGFNVHRVSAADVARRQVNERLILAGDAETYSIVDKRSAARRYELEVVRPDGRRCIAETAQWPPRRSRHGSHRPVCGES